MITTRYAVKDDTDVREAVDEAGYELASA